MAWFWRLGTGAVLLGIATPAAAQDQDWSVMSELRRANDATRAYCEGRTEDKRQGAVAAREKRDTNGRYQSRVNDMDAPSLEAEEAALNRRIMLAQARGDSTEDTGPNSLGDMIKRRDTVRTLRAGGTNYYQTGAELDENEYQTERRSYNDALLNCLEFKDRYPDRAWHDPKPPVTSAAYGNPDGEVVGYETMPDAVPEDDGQNHRAWMTGTFDTGGGVMTLNPAGGKYEYANGRLSTTAINGPVMEGIWTQDSSGQQCKDGGYHGKFRLVFTAEGFSGLFGYCDEPPAAQGGFYGTRRKQ